jgi:hypothetical protein
MTETLEMPAAVRPEIEALLSKAQSLIEDGRNFLFNEGTMVDTTKYLTIRAYRLKHGLSGENVVMNWIERGIIPANDVIVLKELNNLKMVADKKYK